MVVEFGYLTLFTVLPLAPVLSSSRLHHAPV